MTCPLHYKTLPRPPRMSTPLPVQPHPLSMKATTTLRTRLVQCHRRSMPQLMLVTPVSSLVCGRAISWRCIRRITTTTSDLPCQGRRSVNWPTRRCNTWHHSYLCPFDD